MKSWIYYNWLAVTDLFRLWSSTQHHVIIVAGICLPILLLLGLKAGHVAKLREELVTSPTGRQVIFYSAQSDSFITREFADKLASESADIELVIPESQRPVQIRRKSEKQVAPVGVTVYPTRPGDPILDQFAADVLEDDERGIVLTKAAADHIGVAVGETVAIGVSREKFGVLESASVDVDVKKIVTFGAEDENVGFVPLPTLARIEQYVRGFKVEEFGWPAMKAPVRDRYASFLVFCGGGKDRDLTPRDKKNIEEADYELKRVEEAELRSLYGLIAADKVATLNVYEIYTTNSREDFKFRMSLSPSELKVNVIVSNADPIVIAWNRPIGLKFRDRNLTAIGLSFSERHWFRNYLVDRTSAFTYDAQGYLGKLVRNGVATSQMEPQMRLTLSDGQQFQVGTRETEDDASGGGRKDGGQKRPAAGPERAGDKDGREVIVLPVNVLAQIDAYQNKAATFDAESGLFVPVADPVRFDKARVYATSIDVVPAIVGSLLKLNVAVESETGRIKEIHEQDGSLQLLVFVVGLGVFLFGIITVFSVLLDSTDRKRGAIGILRVMGISRRGIFYVVVVRAILIGLFAGVLTVVVGYLVAWLLAVPAPSDSAIAAWKPEITILILLPDVLTVFCGALLVAGIGALVPGLRASREAVRLFWTATKDPSHRFCVWIDGCPPGRGLCHVILRGRLSPGSRGSSCCRPAAWEPT